MDNNWKLLAQGIQRPMEKAMDSLRSSIDRTIVPPCDCYAPSKLKISRRKVQWKRMETILFIRNINHRSVLSCNFTDFRSELHLEIDQLENAKKN